MISNHKTFLVQNYRRIFAFDLKAKIHTYSLLLLGIFLLSFVLRAVHFLEHQLSETTTHVCAEHNTDIDASPKHDCSLCDFTLSSFTEFDFFSFTPLLLLENDAQPNLAYHQHFLSFKPIHFSLRAPPFV